MPVFSYMKLPTGEISPLRSLTGSECYRDWNHRANAVTPVICGVNLFVLQLKDAASEQMPKLWA